MGTLKSIYYLEKKCRISNEDNIYEIMIVLYVIVGRILFKLNCFAKYFFYYFFESN